MSDPEKLRELLTRAAEDRAALDALAAALKKKDARAAAAAAGAEAAPALAGLLLHGAKAARQAAAELLGEIGEAAAEAAPALARAAVDEERAVRQAALRAIERVGGPLEAYEEALAAALDRGDEAAPPALARFGRAAEIVVRGALSAADPKARKAAAQALLAISHHLECADYEGFVLECLESEQDFWRKLGLELVQRLRHPTPRLLEPVADLSRLAGAKAALLRFPKDALKRELTSLIKSRAEEERLVGLELAQHLGPEAGEFAPLIAEVLAKDTRADSARAAVHTLAQLLPDAALAGALTPALDHWDAEVQKAARRYLKAAAAPVRDSVWEGHPFSDALRVQLQRLGFTPKAPIRIPDERPLPDRPFEWEPRLPEDDAARLSPAIFGLLYSVERPPHELYTLWGSYENSHTFYFSSEAPIYVIDIRGTRRLMHVVGDGSIGYYAAVDLRDGSDDPALYYIGRWGGGEGWMVSFTLSAYLRRLDSRKAKK